MEDLLLGLVGLGACFVVPSFLEVRSLQTGDVLLLLDYFVEFVGRVVCLFVFGEFESGVGESRVLRSFGWDFEAVLGESFDGTELFGVSGKGSVSEPRASFFRSGVAHFRAEWRRETVLKIFERMKIV